VDCAKGEQMKLITKEAWEQLSPRSKGYVIYSQSELKGSQLKGLTNPYRKGSKHWNEFVEGERIACQDAQDQEK
jgi:hypothetical protein